MTPYNELVYFIHKMKYNVIDNEKNYDLKKTMIVFGKNRTGKTTLKNHIENILQIETNTPNLFEEESITHNGYTIYFTNNENQYKKDETNVFVELIQQY